MPQPATPSHRPGGTVAPPLRRLLEFTEPSSDDVCLDVARGPGPLPRALRPWVRHVAAVDAPPPLIRERNGRMPTVAFGAGPARVHGGSDPVRAAPRPRARGRGGPDGPASPIRAVRPVPYDGDGARRHDPDTPTVRADATALPYRTGAFTLVTVRSSLLRLGDPRRVLPELLRVCRPGGRLVVAELVRPAAAGRDRDRLERLRDPDHPGTPSVAELTELIASAGGGIRRLDVFTVERPVEPWLAECRDPRAAERIRDALVEEVGGGPRTGARPRLIGGELWFTQNWAHIAAEPVQGRVPAPVQGTSTAAPVK